MFHLMAQSRSVQFHTRQGSPSLFGLLQRSNSEYRPFGEPWYKGSSSYMGCGPKCTFWSPDNITEWFWWDSYMWQVPVDQREEIIQRYFELYRSEFSEDAESFRDLRYFCCIFFFQNCWYFFSSEDLYLITSFLGMDSQTYMPTFQKARKLGHHVKSIL